MSKTNKKYDITTTWIKITPRKARDLIDTIEHNRPLRRAYVRTLAGVLHRGEWRYDGNTIKVDWNDRVIDGQHRLHAIVESGVPIWTQISYGYPPEAIHTIDSGIARSGSDVIYMDGQPAYLSKTVAAAIRYIRAYELKRHWHNGKHQMTNLEIYQYADAHSPEIFDQCRWVNSLIVAHKPYLTRSLALFLYHLFAKEDSDMAKEFITQLFTGERLTKKNVIYYLRDILEEQRHRKVEKMIAPMRIKLVIRSWNIYRGEEERVGSKDALKKGLEDIKFISIR